MAFFDNELTTEGNSTVGGILQEFGNLLQSSLVNSLFEKGSSDTAKLSQSIIFDIDFSGNAWSFQLSMEDYGKFIDQGVQGIGTRDGSETKNSYLNVAPNSPFRYQPTLEGKPSVSHFTNWAARKGLSAFAVRESVWRKGIKPNHFYSSIVDENLINELVKNLEQFGAVALEKEIADSIKGSIK